MSSLTSNPLQKSIAVIYHSNYGHTQKVALAILVGVQHFALTENFTLNAVAIDIDSLNEDAWQTMDNADMLILGSPVYMGSMTARFKAFMDDTSKRWYHRRWQGKWAAGFANSGGLSGDKLAVLQQINLFAMQHGMLWAGLPLMPSGNNPEDMNRLSGFLGLMTQSDNASADITPPEGDLATAEWFGAYLAELVVTGKARVLHK